MKVFKIIGFSVLSLALAVVMRFCESQEWPISNNIAGILLGLSLPAVWHSIQDVTDTTSWKVAQRKLKRGRFITDKTIVRISFAYLYRIKVGNRYLLIKNARGTGKYQPVGGVYKLQGNEKDVLRKRYQVKDDNKMPIDKSSRDDYRLRMENKYLRRFVRRFDWMAERERIDNLSREFREELVETGIVDWEQITYRYCGRHIMPLQFGEHFQIYELLLADVVELIPTEEQELELRELSNQEVEEYRFATAEEIRALGINTELNLLEETIADHAQKIIEENEGQLMKMCGTGRKYTITLET